MNEPDGPVDDLPEDALYPIRTVCAITGVNPVTLRAWERRYDLLQPRRTPKGHRLYTKAQIETIRRVVALLGQGIAISQVKPLLAEASSATRPMATEGDNAGDLWATRNEQVLDAISHFDTPSLDQIYSDTLSLYPVDTVTRHMTIPVLETLGSRWRVNRTGIAEEHFFNAYLRNKLGARCLHRSASGDGALLLAACLPAEQHETGLLLFSLSAIAHGFRLIYLGANMPLEELPLVVERSEADAIVLSSAIKPKPAVLGEQLPDLVHRISVPLFVGGQVAVTQEKSIAAAGALPVGTDIPEAIRRIKTYLR